MHFFVVSLNTKTKELNKVSALPKLSYSEPWTLHVIVNQQHSQQPLFENTFLRFFSKSKKTWLFTFFEVSCQKNVKNVESLIQVSCTQIRLPHRHRRRGISCKIRAFCKFFMHIFSDKNVLPSQSWLTSYAYGLPVSDDYKIGYFPKCRLLGAL